MSSCVLDINDLHLQAEITTNALCGSERKIGLFICIDQMWKTEQPWSTNDPSWNISVLRMLFSKKHFFFLNGSTNRLGIAAEVFCLCHINMHQLQMLFVGGWNDPFGVVLNRERQTDFGHGGHPSLWFPLRTPKKNIWSRQLTHGWRQVQPLPPKIIAFHERQVWSIVSTVLSERETFSTLYL